MIMDELMKNGLKRISRLFGIFNSIKEKQLIFFEIEANIQLLAQLSFQNHIVYTILGLS